MPDYIDLQNFILEQDHKYINEPLSYSCSSLFDEQDDNDKRVLKLMSSAKKAGFTEEDFEKRNEFIIGKKNHLRPVRCLKSAVVGTYVTSSNYFNTPLRRSLNIVHSLSPLPEPGRMGDIISKFRRESDEASYGRGMILEGTVEAMSQLDKLKPNLRTSLLKNHIAEDCAPAHSYRGVLASPSFIKQLDYSAASNGLVRTDQFLSTSLSYFVANDFASGKYENSTAAGKSVIFEVSGYSGAKINAFIDEDEVLYPPDTFFAISKAGMLKRMLMNAQVYKLKEVSAPSDTSKVMFLSDVGKLQQQRRQQ